MEGGEGEWEGLLSVSVGNAIYQRAKGLVAKETMVSCRWWSKTRKFYIKQDGKGQMNIERSVRLQR